MTAETTWQHTWPWPLWMAVLAGAVLVALVIWIYRREPRGSGSWEQVILPWLRVLVMLLVLWMMLGWIFQRHRTEPADLIIGLDDSASMAFAHDDWDAAVAARVKRIRSAESESETSTSRFDIARSLLDHPRTGWLETLRKHYNVRTVLLSDSVRELPAESTAALKEAEPNRPASRLGTAVRAMVQAQRGRPTAAIVLLTDGVTTEGPSLVDAASVARQAGIPLFCVGIGSEKPVRDLWLSDLLADDVAFIDDTITVSCQLHVTGFAGQKTQVKLTRTDTPEKQTLAEQTVELPAGSDRLPLRLSFRARTEGEYQLSVVAAPLEGEIDASNNQLSHRVRVHDSTIRVLLVQSSPSYEYRKLRDLLARATKPSGDHTNKAFTLSTILQEADPEWVKQEATAINGFPLNRDDLFAYDVVILGDANPMYVGTSSMANLVDFVEQRGGGLIFVAGPRFMPLAYRGTPLEKLLPFDLSTASTPNEKTPLENAFQVRLTPIGQLLPPCQLLPSPEENARLWSQLPGMYWNVDMPDAKPAARVVLEHPVRTNTAGGMLPLVLLQYFGAGKVIFQGIDETYRWARHEGGEDYYARYWFQLIRYAGRSKFLQDESSAELVLERQEFEYGENVPIRVRFRQAGLAPNGADSVTVVVQPEAGTAQQLVLQRETEDPPTFSGAVAGLSAGQYRVSLGAPSLPTPPPTKTFEVAPPAQERATPLDSKSLQASSQVSRGHYYPLRSADRLVGDLPRGERLRIESLPARPIWNSPYVAGLVIALLTTEWILRKRVGLL